MIINLSKSLSLRIELNQIDYIYVNRERGGGVNDGESMCGVIWKGNDGNENKLVYDETKRIIKWVQLRLLY